MPRSNKKSDFWFRVDIRGLDECWPWKGSHSKSGYGKISFAGKDWRANRLAFFFLTGQKPPAVLHTCDNRSCCNPAHLFAGTNGSNNKDRATKGRSHRPAGELHPLSKLTAAAVVEIRALAHEGVPRPAIAEKFKIHRGYVDQIVRGDRWRHLA